MALKYHPVPLSGRLRKALKKELGQAHAMTTVFAQQVDEYRAKGEALIRKADKLSCESLNERIWANRFERQGATRSCIRNADMRVIEYRNASPTHVIFDDRISRMGTLCDCWRHSASSAVGSLAQTSVSSRV
jgi:hypothetical protein